MEKSQECLPGFAIESDMLIIAVMDPLDSINGERLGRPHGYRKNGRGLNFLG